MKNTKQTNNNTEDENSLSEKRQDVACSEGEAVTELSPSSGSPKTERIMIKNKDQGDESFYNASIDFYNYLCDMIDGEIKPESKEFKEKSDEWIQRLRRDWTTFN